MIEHIINWGIEQGLSAKSAEYMGLLAAFALIILVSMFLLYLSHFLINTLGQKIVSATKTKWDDVLRQKRFFRNVAHLIPVIFISLLIPKVFAGYQHWIDNFNVIIELYLIIVFYLIINSVVNACWQIYKDSGYDARIPLSSFFQIVKLAVLAVATLLFVSKVLGKSPTYLLSGLGALTAVLILVFRDTLQGLVAGVQVAVNRMLAHGDWIEMPSENIDGVVLDVGLNTVQVRNWDNTIAYLPTYKLISEPFKNWRGMQESQGRRFKRSINLDPNSVIKTEQDKTNLQAYIAWIEVFLSEHPQVQSNLTSLVRIVSPNQYGVPLEIYFFIKDKEWKNYENIASDIYARLLAELPEFELKAHVVK